MDFNTEVNPALIGSRDPISEAVKTLYGGTVASLVDVGASIWNTLPGDEVDTEDLLAKIGGDPLKVYQEHSSAVQAASLIGGSFLPAGLALKGMNMLRNGARAAKWFSNAGKVAREEELVSMFNQGRAATQEYKNLLWANRASTVGNNVLDAGAAELAMLGTMGAHPLLEDYWKDPATNFGISLAIGGGLGAVGGLIIDNNTIRQATGAAEKTALQTVYEAVRPTVDTMPDTTRLQTNSISIKNLGEMIENGRSTGKIAENDLLMSVADKMRKDLELKNGEILDGMLSPELRELPQADKNYILQELTDNPAMHGVQTVRTVTAKEILDKYKQGTTLTDDPTLQTTVKGIGPIQTEAAYFPDIKKFGSVSDIQHHAGAAALDMTEEALIKSKTSLMSKVPNFDSAIEHVAKTTPAIDGDYIGWMLKFNKMDEDKFLDHLKTSLLSADDIPQLQAIATKMAQSPRLQNLGKVRIADRFVEAEQVIKGIDARRTLGGTPVKYQEAFERIANNATVDTKFDIRKTRPGSPEAIALDSWIGGNTFGLHKSATAYFARGYAKQSQSEGDKLTGEIVKHIYESAESKQLRKELMEIADKDGMIYAFRGVKTSSIAGQSPLESFAVTVEKTRQFTGAAGKTMLYKIDVEDVVAAVHDIGKAGDNVELIVRPTARQAEATLDTQGRIKFREELERNLASQVPVAKEANFKDIYSMIKDGKFSLIQEMITRGYSMDVIAKRVNVPEESIRQFFASDRSRAALDNIDVIKYKTAEMAADALTIKNKPLIMKGSSLKTDYTKGHANLNARQLQQMNQMVIGAMLANSKAPAALELHKLFYQDYESALSVLRSKMGMINNELAGATFLSSTDHVMRRMEDVGPIISTIGKSITEVSNQMEARIVRPLSDILVKVGDDAASLTELNVGYQLYNRLKGQRFYKDRQFWQVTTELNAEGKPVDIMKAVTFEGKEFKVVSDAVDEFFTKAGQAGKELLEMSNTGDTIMGISGRSDLGYWLPALNPINKHIAYLHDKAADTTRMIYGKTAEELESGIASFTEDILKSEGNLMIVRKGDQRWWNYTNGRSESIHMEAVDASKLKTGAGASAIVPTGREVLSELVGGYQHYINASVRRLSELSISDVVDTLRTYSSMSKKGFDSQPLGFIKRVISRPKDIGGDTLNTILGNPLIKDHEGWRSASQVFDVALTKSIGFTQDVWHTMKKGLPSKLSAEDMKKFDYEAYEKKLAEAGVLNPFEHLDRAMAEQLYSRSKLTDNPDLSKRVISASNGLVSTMALRFGELAHPLVNLMSMPIMTALANSRHMPERFMGVQRATREVSTTQVMYEGIRSMNSPRFAALNKEWEKLGYFKPLVSEATEAMQDARKFEKGAVAKVEQALNSSFVSVMSKPADYSESLSRKIMMHTGYQLGKRLYPELPDKGLTIFARDFMDKALGNYSASQRPVMFQGTLGMAMGLFQTYMLTLAQNVYRNVELRDWKTLAKGMLAQNTIFGFSSMPGFEPISKMIGDNFSEEHYDLRTGLYKAVGQDADWILHGLPSNIVQSNLYTRGNVDPRFPNLLAGFDNLAAYNMLGQASQLVGNMARAVGQGSNAGQAMLEAFSLQSLSRPIARASEIGMALTGEGGSVNSAGKTVQTSDEVLTINGIMSRILASRPYEEAKLREMQSMNRFYEARDSDRRKKVINELRTAFRNGNNTPDVIADIAERYMRNGGSPVGWRTAYRTAQATTNTPGSETFIDSLDEENPLNHMIDSLD